MNTQRYKNGTRASEILFLVRQQTERWVRVIPLCKYGHVVDERQS